MREDEARGRQGPQRRAVELLVEGTAADAQLLHRPVVELVPRLAAGTAHRYRRASSARRLDPARGRLFTRARISAAIHRTERGPMRIGAGIPPRSTAA